MKTDYKNINSFEVWLVFLIAVGFVILGIVLFSSLTPRVQASVSVGFDLFDMHEEFAGTVEGVKFVLDIPNEFYEQFYIAFTEIAVLPPETFEVPRDIAVELARNFSSAVSSAVNNLSEQVQAGYEQRLQTEIAAREPNGQVLGSFIDRVWSNAE